MPGEAEDRNLRSCRTLVAPDALRAAFPPSLKAAETVAAARDAIRDAIHGRDERRLVVVVGPCSIHDPSEALEFAHRLKRTAEPLQRELIVVMRTYFEKPRTRVGWKGLLNDPALDGSCDVRAGLVRARQLLLAINELGVPCGAEVLDPLGPHYLGDLLCWAAIGARTVESQTHRQLASGLAMPVGFKNGTDGRVDVAVDALVAAGHPHSFLGLSPEGTPAVVETRGNPDRHLILRGGGGRTNYHPRDVREALRLLGTGRSARCVAVDCSHGNSDKDPDRQEAVLGEVLRQLRAGQHAILGALIESNLEAGRQRREGGKPLRYGVSITNACIGWKDTERLLTATAEQLRARA